MLLLVTAALGGAWDALGPVAPPERLAEVTTHAEYVRARVEGPSGPYWIEVTPDRGGAPWCVGGGLALQVRRDLGATAESFELPDPPPAVTAACARLAEAAPALRTAMAEAAASRPPPAPPPPPAPAGVPLLPEAHAPRPFQAVVLAWAGALAAWALRGAWRAPGDTARTLAVAALALAARLAVPPTALLGGDAAYERLVAALGRGDADRYYGETWPSLGGLLGAAWAAAGHAGASTGPGAELTAFVHLLNLGASVVTVAALVPLATRLAPRASAVARLAPALLLALHPQAVALARIEDHLVTVAALQALAVAAALGQGRLDAVVAVLSATLLGHLRPEQLPVAALALLPLLARRRWLPLALAAGLLGARLAYLPAGSASAPIDWSRLLRVGDWPDMLGAALLPAGAAAPGVLLLAAAGARARPLAAAMVAASLLIYLPKSQPLADPLRFGLPTVTWLVVLAGAGIERLHHRVRARWPALPGGAAWAWPALALLLASRAGGGRPWAWEAEYAAAREWLPRVAVARDDVRALTTDSPGPRGWYDTSQDPTGAMGRWLAFTTGMPWSGWGDGRPAPGDVAWRGVADHLAGGWAGRRCGAEVVAEREVAPGSDGWVDLGAGPVRVGLYRLHDCAGMDADPLPVRR